MSAHDRWLANYRGGYETAYCENPSCDNHPDGIAVMWEEEYGQGWTTPEDCPICHHSLTFDRPPEATEDDLSDEDPETDL